MRTAFMVVHRPSLMEFGEDRFLAVMLHAGVEIETDAHGILEWGEAYWAFRSYGLDACIMLGNIPDHIRSTAIYDELKITLGDDFKPLIVMVISPKKEEVEE